MEEKKEELDFLKRLIASLLGYGQRILKVFSTNPTQLKKQILCKHTYSFHRTDGFENYNPINNSMGATYEFKCNSCGRVKRVSAFTINKKINNYDKINDKDCLMEKSYSIAIGEIQLVLEGKLIELRTYGVAAVIQEYKSKGLNLEQIDDFYKK